MTPTVSVVVATYRRPHLLPGLLAALEAQTYPATDFEVVLVDDGSADTTAATIEQLAAASSLTIRPVLLPSNTGRAAARNHGWRAARGRLIAFTDDDCQPAPGWLAAGVAAVEREGGAVIAGRTIPNPAQRHLLGPFARTVVNEHTKWIPTCNAFFLRADIEAVGGFDEAFSTKGGEDTDLAWRVEATGRPIVYAEDALVHHEVYPSDFGAKVRETLAWTSIPLLMARHPDATRARFFHRYFWMRSHPWVILGIAGLVLAGGFRRRWPLLLLLPWLDLRMRRQPASGWRKRFQSLPGVFVIDALEVGVMAKGSVEHRTFVL